MEKLSLVCWLVKQWECWQHSEGCSMTTYSVNYIYGCQVIKNIWIKETNDRYRNSGDKWYLMNIRNDGFRFNR